MKRLRLITPLLALSFVALGAVAVRAQVCPKTVSGAIFTTNANGTVVNGNIYKNCCDVYLNGGPPPNAPCTSAGLPDGDYYYMVTDPSGKVLLSTDDISHRTFHVTNGVMVSAAGPYTGKCNHQHGLGKCGTPTISIQLMPFSETPNPGGEYKAWATPVGCYDAANGGRNDVGGEKYGFIHSKSKTDNFKCHPPRVCAVTCPKNPDNVCADAFPTCTATVNVPQPTTDCPSPVITAVRSDGVPITYNPGGLYATTGPFPIGETDVIWTVTSSGLTGTVTCLQFVNVDDCDTPWLKCKDDVKYCNDKGLCSANPDLPRPDYHATCATGALISLNPSPTGPYPVGKTLVTWTAIFTNSSYVLTCTQYVTVEDCECPVITCPTVPPISLKCVNDTTVDFNVSATDNCTSPDKIIIVCKDQTGKEVHSGDHFVAGEYDITCTATDEAGKSCSCTFHISITFTPCCDVVATKFNDLNGDGIFDPVTETLMSGVVFTFDWTEPNGTTGHVVKCSDIFGNAGPVPIPDGSTYSITETLPSTGDPNCTWKSTTGTTVNGVIHALSCPGAFLFGNICVCNPAGGFTPGFWSNKNGQAILAANDPAWRNLLGTLCLRDASGTAYFVPGGAFGDDSSGAYGNFRTWLLGGNAVNMAYMLSVQLSANVLNGAYKGLSDSTNLILDSGTAACYGSATANLGAVRAAAVASLCAHGYTPSGDPNRAYQECLKNILDGANNNSFQFSGGSCIVANPCIP